MVSRQDPVTSSLPLYILGWSLCQRINLRSKGSKVYKGLSVFGVSGSNSAVIARLGTSHSHLVCCLSNRLWAVNNSTEVMI